MPRPRKPVRLQWFDERKDGRGYVKQRPEFVILDGEKRVGTGCGAGQLEAAQRALEAYLAKRHREAKPIANKAAADTMVADVISYYADSAKDVARPKELASRLGRLLDWWGDKTPRRRHRLRVQGLREDADAGDGSARA